MTPAVTGRSNPTRRKMGMPVPSIRYFTSVPWLARALIDLHPEYGLLMHLDQHTADVLTLVVSQENSCRFCYAAQRALLWGLGMSEARIQRLEQELSASLAPRTAAAIAFGRSQSRMGRAGAWDARQALRRAGFSDEEIKEIAYTTAATDSLTAPAQFLQFLYARSSGCPTSSACGCCGP